MEILKQLVSFQSTTMDGISLTWSGVFAWLAAFIISQVFTALKIKSDPGHIFNTVYVLLMQAAPLLIGVGGTLRVGNVVYGALRK
jgi:hypothetical protein